VKLAPGELLRIALAERPTAGYRWEIEADGAPVCTLVSNVYDPPGDARPGRPGGRSWTFRVVRAGRAEIVLAARRPWEKQAPPASTFRITISAV